MKIQPDGTKVVKPAATTPAAARPTVKSFGDLLREKAKPKLPKMEEPPADPAQLNLATTQLRDPATPQVEIATPESAPVQQVPPAIQALCNELVDRIDQTGPTEIKIEFRSNVLDGLSVTALREGNAFEIQLHTATPQTAALLSGNSPVLAERLERLGYKARISVRRVPARAPEPRR
jgi:hypothetical protein